MILKGRNFSLLFPSFTCKSSNETVANSAIQCHCYLPSFINIESSTSPKLDFCPGLFLQLRDVALRAETRTLNGEGGEFIYSCSARRISFQIKFKLTSFPQASLEICDVIYNKFQTVARVGSG